MSQEDAFLDKWWNRIIVASVVGIAMIVLGGIILLIIGLIVSPGFAPDHGPYVLLEILASGGVIAYFPPFIPALLPAIFVTRKSSEGLVAGFVTYLSVAIVGYEELAISHSPCYTGLCGLPDIIPELTPFLGVFVGAVGGAIGARRAGHRAASAQTESRETEAKGAQATGSGSQSDSQRQKESIAEAGTRKYRARWDSNPERTKCSREK